MLLIGGSIVFLLLLLLIFIYPVTGILRFGFMKKIYKNKKRRYLFLAALIPGTIEIVFCFISFVDTVAVVAHLSFFLAVCDVIRLFISKATKKNPAGYICTLIAFAATTVYLGIGMYNIYHVRQTEYTITTDKNIGEKPIRIVQIADSHIGTTFHADGFSDYLKQIESVNPDIVLFTGDFVDDDSTKDDMIKCCEALGKMKTTYGVYMVYGNHDKGYSNYRDFTYKDLEEELKKNNVPLLQDETVLIDDRFYIVGRQDRSTKDRATAEELTNDLDSSKYIIILDHQPNDYDNEAATCADLVLSGHTHGGQLIPIGPIGELIGANDATYGLYEKNGTSFIVNSGISDWAVHFKTGAFSEYGIIDIIPD